MELKAEESEYSIEYKSYTSDFHVINARYNEDGVDAATRAMEGIKKKKISPEEKENEKSMYVQKQMNILYKHPIEGDQWQASFLALRSLITGQSMEEAMKEAKKQTTLEQHAKEEEKKEE